MQTKLFIDGELTDGLAGRGIDVINPADGTVLATVAEAGAEDIDRAVAAAQRAFPAWAARPAAERGRLLTALADAIESHAGELAQLESSDTGHPMAMHRDRVLNHLKVAVDAGATILTGGMPPADDSMAGGYYLRPTVIEAAPDSQVCQEEIFGPVVTVSTFATDEEAVAIANGTEYGLGGGLWTSDLSRAHRVASAMRAGMVWVNCYKRVNPGSPFGGTGRSGYGREMGFAAMDEYTTRKPVWVNVDAPVPDWYA